MSKGKVQVFAWFLLWGAPMGVAFAEEKEAQLCVKLQQVDLHDGARLLSEGRQRKLFKAYMGRCIDGQLLQAMISDASNFYMQRGNITTRAYLKNQNIDDGQVDISILKGSIEDIVDAKTHVSNARIKTAFAFQKGKILNLRDLETSLEAMNRVRSSAAKFDIKPGHKRGTSIVEVQSRDVASPHQLKVGLSGWNSLQGKNLLLTAELSTNNLLNINDILTFRYNGSGVQREFQSTNVGELNYSFPVASYLMELIASRFSYRQGVNGIANTYLSNGQTDGIRLRIGKILMRNQNNKLNAALSVYHKNTKNYFSKQLIAVSSYKTTLAQFDLTHTYLQDWGRLTTTYSYYRGTDWFGARTDGYISIDPTANNQAKLQFQKHSIDMNALYFFNDKSYQINSNFYLQYTKDLLYDNDKLTVGTDYTVRGYLNRNLYGNNAWYIKNDLVKTWPSKVSPRWLQSTSLFVGADYGQVRCERDNQSSCGNVYGVAAGLRTHGKNMTTNFVWSRPLKKNHTKFQI